MAEAEPSASPGHPMTVAGGAVRLPRPPGAIRRFWSRHPRLVDGLVAAAYFIPTIAGTIATAQAGTVPAWAVVVAIIVVAGTTAVMFLFRRRRPWVLAAAAWCSSLLVYPLESVDVFAILVALYALAVYGSTRAAWIALGISAVVGIVSAFIAAGLPADGGATPTASPYVASALVVAAMLIATLIGVNVGNQRRYLAALIARVGDLARERDQQARLATAVERSRIAREMHDIVSHSLTVMVTLAEGSAAAATTEPARAADGMRIVAEAGRDALADMRRMLGVLSEPAASATEGRKPQPGTAALPDLIGSFRAAGLPVRLSMTGAPVADANLELTVYRIVQEALTNTLRHAASAQHVDVSISHSDGEVRIEVVDDAVPAAAVPADDGGHGLIGMRERVALYGGSFTAGPRPFGGWRVHAVLPTSSAGAVSS
ncbi:sensor histidine kinase [Microbacterium sp. NPDC057407]|uniref:sensor histidine kinase n=1 Tax=Microbacterium sp. NPDC057407 TaxID=3346120 RepID=UPI003671FAC8